jgi:amino acid transporter
MTLEPQEAADADGRDPAEDPAARVRLRRAPHLAGVEPAEMVQGAKPGTRFARRVRDRERRFQPTDAEGVITATRHATAPRTRAGHAWARVRMLTVGSPISSEHQEEQRLSKTKALAVFSSDALSSSAYATDEILLYLSVAGVASLTYSVEVAGAIALLLGIVVFSYRQTIKAYPNGGGAYIVARENLGDRAGLTAAAALGVDYVLTVSVSIAAGVLAITSAFPELAAYRIELAVGCIGIITLANLRGVKESGTLFAIPTYGFIVAMGTLLVVGFARVIIDPGLRAEIPESVHEPGTSALTAFIVLRAFASGCAALTGVEAISNGIPAFKKPEARNASTTLVAMGVILTTLFLGITVLAHQLGIQHSPEISVPAQIGKTVFGGGPAFILILAANTAYADFPRLASILAVDRFVPHQFTFRGDRLAFSNGIVVLGVLSSAVIVAFDADLNQLIPLYAFGVFVSFTLSQSGMIVHWLRLREPGWRSSMAINAVGASATAVVAGIIGFTKFADGAWLSMTTMAVLAIGFWLIHRHYSGVDRRLAIHLGAATRRYHRHTAIVPVEGLDRAALATVEYARTVTPNVVAVHVTDERGGAQALRARWEESVLDVPLVLIRSPHRSFVAPVMSYLDSIQHDGVSYVTVVFAEYRSPWPWVRWLHNQSARRLRAALVDRSDTAVATLPYSIAEWN